jgi:hypothetical protein
MTTSITPHEVVATWCGGVVTVQLEGAPQAMDNLAGPGSNAAH